MLEAFLPTPRKLMGPGPSDVNPAILKALSLPTVGHLDPQFIALMDQVKDLLQYAFDTQNSLTMPVSAPGSAGMEACFVNLVEAGDKVIVCQNGVFGTRMQANVERCGGQAIVVEDEWGHPTDPDKLRAALEQHPDTKIVAFVHAETSTGVRNDAQLLCHIAKQHGCLTLVDAVTSLAGIELRVDDWQIDAIYSGTQKCLSCVPGISPVSFSQAAIDKLKQRQQPVQSWFLDMQLVMGYWGEGEKRAYHHTAPVNNIYALHESLRLLQQEGRENAWARHQQNHQLLHQGLQQLGLELVVAAEHRLPQLNTVRIPQGVDDARVRQQLLQDYDLEIGAGLGALAGKVWRIGLMGYGSNPANVEYCLQSLGEVLNAQ